MLWQPFRNEFIRISLRLIKLLLHFSFHPYRPLFCKPRNKVGTCMDVLQYNFCFNVYKIDGSDKLNFTMEGRTHIHNVL